MIESTSCQSGDSKTKNNITVVIHRVTPTTVYFARLRGESWDGENWPLCQMARPDFEREWEAA